MVAGVFVMAHRIAWELTNGPIPVGLMVLHRCDRPPCIRPDHLFLGTHADNMRDMIAKGRAPLHRGESNPHAKLTRSQVEQIRALYKGLQHRFRPRTGPTQTELAEQFGVTQEHIASIVRGACWAD